MLAMSPIGRCPVNIERHLALLVLVCAAVSHSGCASILSKSTYAVAVDSSPSQANFVVKGRDGEVVADGITPATVTLPAKQGFFLSSRYQVEFEKPGYVAQTVPLNSSVDEWYFGNVILGGLLGMLIVDPATGAMWELPEDVTTTLAEHPEKSTGIQQASHTELSSDEPTELY